MRTKTHKDKYCKDLTTITEDSKGTTILLDNLNGRVGEEDQATVEMLDKHGEEEGNDNGKGQIE